MYNLISNNQVDKKRWDDAIRQSDVPFVNAESWFLDILSPGWEAIVNKDYSVLVPIPVKRKYMLRAALQPLLCQQLGVFCLPGQTIDFESISSLLKKHYSYIDICVNKNSEQLLGKSKVKSRINHILNLDRSIEDLRCNYSKSHLKNLRRANRHQPNIKEISIENAIKFLKKEYVDNTDLLAKDTLDNYERMLYVAKSKVKVACLGVYIQEELLAVATLIYTDFHMKSFYVASGEGKSKKVLFYLIDNILCRYANTKMFFDFGGSDIDSIAYFNTGFGASPQTYYQLKWNKIPFL